MSRHAERLHMMVEMNGTGGSTNRDDRGSRRILQAGEADPLGAPNRGEAQAGGDSDGRLRPQQLAQNHRHRHRHSAVVAVVIALDATSVPALS